MHQLQKTQDELRLAHDTSLDLLNASKRQLAKCAEQRVRERRIRLDKVKLLAQNVYDAILQAFQTN